MPSGIWGIGEKYYEFLYFLLKSKRYGTIMLNK